MSQPKKIKDYTQQFWTFSNPTFLRKATILLMFRFWDHYVVIFQIDRSLKRAFPLKNLGLSPNLVISQKAEPLALLKGRQQQTTLLPPYTIYRKQGSRTEIVMLLVGDTFSQLGIGITQFPPNNWMHTFEVSEGYILPLYYTYI